MECYFREHMAERDLLFLEEPRLRTSLVTIPKVSQAKQQEYLASYVVRDTQCSGCQRSVKIASYDSLQTARTFWPCIKEEGNV